MAFESFYGGRQGASIVIVKQFDAIDTNKTISTYKGCYLAITPDVIDNQGRHTYLYVDGDFIRRDASNYTSYAWDFVVLDGTEMPTKSSITDTTVTYRNLPAEPVEGMVQCFSLGGDSTDVVNYGEYVIIDTPNKSDPDNGKIYRRGLTYDDPLAGAEYIGQVVGPQGDAPELGINTESYIKTIPGYHSGEYNRINESIIPGKGIDGSIDRVEQYVGSYDPDIISVTDFLTDKVPSPSSTTVYYLTNIKTSKYEYYIKEENEDWALQIISYNDKITFSWVTIRDPYGNTEGALIGFTLPYLVHDFIAVNVSPYDINGNIISPYVADGSVKPEINLIERIDDRKHPFYQSWKLSIPKGIKGDDIENLERIDTQAKKGATYYSDVDCTIEAGTISSYLPLDYNNIDFKHTTSIPVIIDNHTYYLKNDGNSTTTSILRYTDINYDNKRLGERTYVDVSPYNIIRSMRLNSYGDLFADYTYENEKEIGRIKIEKSTLGIICKLDDARLLKDDNGIVNIPPEYIEYAVQVRSQDPPVPYIFDPDVGKNEDHIGWLVVIDRTPLDPVVYAFDYIAEQWYLLGSLDGSLLDPASIIQFSLETVLPEKLSNNGVWGPYKYRKCI